MPPNTYVLYPLTSSSPAASVRLAAVCQGGRIYRLLQCACVKFSPCGPPSRKAWLPLKHNTTPSAVLVQEAQFEFQFRRPNQAGSGISTSPTWAATVAYNGSLPVPGQPLLEPQPTGCSVVPPNDCTTHPANSNRIAELPSGTGIEGRNTKAVHFRRVPASGPQSAGGWRRNGAAR